MSALGVIVWLALHLMGCDRGGCPAGWYLEEGVRTSGRYVCRRVPLGRENDGPQPPGELRGRVYCTGGSVPIVVDERTVGCTRRFR